MVAKRDHMVVRALVLTRLPMAYAAFPDWEDEGAEAEFEEYYEEDAPYTGLLGGIEESPTDFAEPDADGAAQEYEFPEDVDEFEATALNALSLT